MNYCDMMQCDNCKIRIKTGKKMVATVKWNDGTEQNYTNELDHPKKDNVFIIPHPNIGFYYLNNNKIIHVINSTKNKTIIYDNSIKHNWFGAYYNDDVFYFPKYNTLIITFFGGDHDYIWWWKLNKCNQYANIEEPAYYNPFFNASLDMRKVTDRYAVVTYFNCTNDCCDSENDNTMTIIFDTKKMIYQEYTTEQLQKRLRSKNTSHSKLQRSLIKKLIK